MGDFRIPYGFALGRANNFYARTDNVFAVADATPDVTSGWLWYTVNTSNTTITHFDLSPSGAGDNAGLFEGKCIRIVFLDNSTSIANAGRIILSSTDNTFLVNSVIDFVYHNSSWVETGRSKNTTAEVSSFTFAGSTSINADGLSLGLLVGTAASVTVRSISGGAIGQTIRLFPNVTNGITVEVMTGGNIFIPGTSGIIMNASGTYTFTRVSGTRWVSEASTVAP